MGLVDVLDQSVRAPSRHNNTSPNRRRGSSASGAGSYANAAYWRASGHLRLGTTSSTAVRYPASRGADLTLSRTLDGDSRQRMSTGTPPTSADGAG